MASKSISFRSQNVSRNENLVAGKKLTKLVSGPTVRRAALGDIANKASLVQRSVSDVNKAKKTEVFKKPAVLRNKKVQNENVPPKNESKCDAIQECSMVSVDTSCSGAPQDMSVIESELQKDAVLEGAPKVEEQEEATVQELSEAFSTKCLTVADIDADDKGNPQLVSEYVKEIYTYMRTLENNNRVQHRYLDGHAVTPRMRLILVDWLVQVHMRFNLMQETLYLTMAILDRYLQIMPDTPKEEVQLVGVTAMFVASKYEEMYCSEIGDFVFISDKAYSKQQIRKMEIQILKKLDYNISIPLPLHFLRRNSKAAQVDGSQHTLAKYLMELCLPDYSMCHYRASEIGAAALYLTLQLTSDEPYWSDTLAYYSGYSEADILPVVCKMANCVRRSRTSNHQTIPQKYRSSKHQKISDMPELQGSLIRSLAAKAASS